MLQMTKCPQCGSADLLVVQLVPRDRPMQFHTCRHCENRWWEDAHDGSDVQLTTVIRELAR